MNTIAKLYVVILIALANFCITTPAISADGEELVTRHVTVTIFGGKYRVTAFPVIVLKDYTKSHSWVEYSKPFKILYRNSKQYYNAFNALYEAINNAEYPGDRYLPVGEWFIPLTIERVTSADELAKLIIKINDDFQDSKAEIKRLVDQNKIFSDKAIKKFNLAFREKNKVIEALKKDRETQLAKQPEPVEINVQDVKGLNIVYGLLFLGILFQLIMFKSISKLKKDKYESTD